MRSFNWGIFFLMGIICTKDFVDNAWKNRIVDNPDYIAAVRSEVLAQQEVERLENGR